jgi:hypothetical protein
MQVLIQLTNECDARQFDMACKGHNEEELFIHVGIHVNRPKNRKLSE